MSQRQRAVIVMFDSLNRHFLSPYGATWTHTPNFARLARQARTYDRSYVASMPCMPARRDLHTGRPGFLRRSWGPLEPWDRSVFADLREQADIYSHLVTDHYHYFEDGGANYHGRYDSWELFRGQEGDLCVGQVADPEVPHHVNGKGRRSDWVNRRHIRDDADYPQTKTFAAGIDFLHRNHDQDRWLLQIECFDPHEPFTTDPLWSDLFPGPDGERETPLYDWPEYGDAPEDALVQQARRRYAALLAKCDASLGKVLDAFDRHNLWDDTMLVVMTDHGIMLGEHGQMMKGVMPLYEQVSHTPLFVSDPRRPEQAGTRNNKLVQPAIDLCPTLHGYFGTTPPDTVLGLDLTDDAATRDAALFGYFNAHVNLVTDRHAYYLGGTGEATAYTVMPSSMRSPFGVDKLIAATQADEPLADSCGARPLCFPWGQTPKQYATTLLYDLEEDPSQENPLTDTALEAELAGQMNVLMQAADAPPEQFDRVGLT